jgi:hypothetical protein
MARTERKALFLRGMPTELVREAKAAAARRGATIATIVAEALARSLGVNSKPQDGTGDLDRDIAWYRKNRSALLRRYRGEYVAIAEAKVVDHGRDFSVLAARVFNRFGNRNIYMPRVEAGEPEARIRSPRRARP